MMTARDRVVVVTNLSMVSLKWGDVLSTMLPGAVLVLAYAPWSPALWSLISRPNEIQLATGVALLFAAAVAGGILEAVTRVAWEPLWLTRYCPMPKNLKPVTVDNLPLYQRSVDSSYKYVTFYANLAWATLALFVTYVSKSPNRGLFTASVLAASVPLLLRASHVQWIYFVRYQKRVFGEREGEQNAGERST